MRALLRGFLAGFGFALGASVAGTLIGYTIGRIGEASVKRLLSPEPTSSPSPSSSQPSSEQPASDDETATTHQFQRSIDPVFGSHFGGACIAQIDGNTCGWMEDAPVHGATQHKSNYGAFSCEQCSYRTSVKEKAFGHHVATGHDIFDEKPDVHRNAAYGALAGTCRRCGSREILQHPDGEYCGKCGYGTPGDRASISVVHDGKCPGETMGICSGGPAHHPDCPAAHHSTDYVVRPDTGDGRSLPCVTCGVTTPDASYRDGLPVCDKCYASATPDDDQDDGSDYFRALDRHDKQPDEEI